MTHDIRVAPSEARAHDIRVAVARRSDASDSPAMRLSIGLVALLVVACRTHTVDDCRPACDAADVEAFAGCVARGTEGCEPGNRRCCALEADCLGMLDDQTVVTSQTACDEVIEDQCWPPCTSEDVTFFEDCVTGSTGLCAGGDDVCCALAADCLGTLGDLVVSAEGCCSGPEDCPTGQACDPTFWTCMATGAR